MLLTQLQGASANLEQSNERVMNLLLEGSNDEEFAAEVNSVQHYRDSVTRAEVIARRALKADPVLSASDCSVITTDNTKLPKLNLPTFSGDVLQWQSFFDSFTAAIDTKRIAPVEKFSYLRGQLRGEASKAIEGLSLTNANYSEALEILKTRFGRKHMIVRAHVKCLLAMDKLPQCQPTTLRKFLNEIEIHIRGLKTLGVTADSYGCILMQIILSKLPNSVCLEWARREDYDATIDEFVAFLRREIQSFELCSDTKSSNRNSSQATEPRFETASSLSATNRNACPVCDEQHYVASCPKLSAMSVVERTAEAKKRRLCFNCLRGGHNVKMCRSASRCKSCGRRHHTLLHRSQEDGPQGEVSHTATTSTNRGEVLLQTALVQLNGES